ncbi:sulfotransferase family 2 domain-containing protein [Sulfitobacter aestuarii]|uniref:Sulfotransferase family 2 domain-containing protein n=1 Tax=Sulfitobacter aestuarii TaxID=2161676 RepID=A0ABW5U6M5_9RHOB
MFFWSQKAACTSLFHFLAENVDVPPENKRYFHLNSQSYKQCLPAIRRQGYRSVILARHPVTRSISAYLNKFCLYRGKILRQRKDLEPFAQELHDLHCARRGITAPHDQANTMSFLEFLDNVASLHAARPKTELPVNGHWETQVPAFLLKQGLRYDDVVHVEALEAELGSLATRLDMRYRPRRMNRTTLAEKRHQGPLVDVPARDVAAHDFGYENFITDETLTRIEALYAVDFRTFGYPLRPAL